MQSKIKLKFGYASKNKCSLLYLSLPNDTNDDELI